MKLSSKIGYSLLVASFLAQTQCSSARPHNETQPAAAATARSEAPKIEPQAADPLPVPTSITNATDLPKEHKSETPAPTHAQHSAPEGVAPEKALSWLMNGNKRFLSGNLRKDGQGKKDIERLSKGQHPHSIIFSCSDSRVPPEVVFDQKLGEVFVVRDAGEVPETASIASMEYAVQHLGARLIVVMGHTQCGAVKAALSTMNGEDAGSPALNDLVKAIHPHLQEFKNKARSADFAAESYAHAKANVQELLAKSEILRKKVASGAVKIKAALYHLDTGKVEFNEE